MTTTIPPNHPKIGAMREAVRQARELWDSKDYAGARSILDRVAADLAAHDLCSPHLDWVLGVTLDYLDEEEASMAHLERALANDPLSLEAARSIEVVLNNARRSLAESGLPDDSPRIATLYNVLRRKDAADRKSHLIYARHQIARGEYADARTLLEAMTKLYYPAPDLYALIAICAERLGDTEGALRASGEVERLGSLDAFAPITDQPDEPIARRSAGQPS